MAATYTLLDSYTVGAGGASSVTLGSGGTIPNTYTDLLVVASTRGASGGVGYNLIRFNSSSSNFSTIEVQGNGSGVTSNSDTGGRAGAYVASTDTSSTFSNNLVYVPNYASSNNKSYSVDSVTENNATAAYATLIAGLWSNTSAITSITFTTSGSVNFAQYSTFYLYGIKNS